MKRFLLSFALFVGLILPAMAVTDGQVYPEINGMKIANQWIFDQVHTRDAYSASVINANYARTATMIGDEVYVGRSLYIPVTDENLQSAILVYSAIDGSFLREMPLTLDGNPYCTFLGATSVGKDSFGHLWVAPMTSNVVNEVPVYICDPQSGALTLVTEMDKGGILYRTDYLDVLGDLTLEQAECNIMTAAGSSESAGFPTIYRWHGDQDGDWGPGFYGTDCYLDLLYFYPETKTGLSLAPIVKMCEDPLNEDTRYSGELFYIDCYDAAPVLYDLDGNIIDTFEYADPAAQPRTYRSNGVLDFTIDGRAFIVYTVADMNNDGNGCQAMICEYNDPSMMSFDNMTPMWTIPADSLGKVNDSGLRVHCFATEKSVDDEGNEVVTLLTFKAQNGMAVYKIGKNVEAPQPQGKKGDVDGNGEVDGTDLNILINILLGKDQNNYEGRENVDEQGGVDGNDLNALINILLGK